MVRPTGRTFRERWASDLATEDWMVGSTVAVAAGGIGGVLAVPAFTAQAITAFPVIALALAVTVVVAPVIGRRRGRLGGAVRRLWTVAVYLLLAGACGVILGALFGVVLAAVCPPAGCESDTSRGVVPGGPLLLAQVLLVIASVICSVGAAILARRLTIRFVNPRTVLDPRALAWQDRRRARAAAAADEVTHGGA